MQNGCLASVIVNNYNYGSFLREAVDSALNQTYQKTEVIVVDDGSTDQSREIIADYGNRILPVMKQNGGQTSALNEGFRQSRGEAVVFLDADDTLFPNAVGNAVRLLSRENVAKVHWPLVEIDVLSGETGKVRCENPPEGDLKDLILRKGPGSYLSPPTSGNAWSRAFLEKVFPLPSVQKRDKISSAGAEGPDAQLSALAPIFGRVSRISEPQGNYRVHGKNGYACRTFDERIEHDMSVFENCSVALRDHCRRLGIDVDPELWKQNSWQHRVYRSVQEITAFSHRGDSFILVDEDQWETGDFVAGRRRIPFMERDGLYWGVPLNDQEAIRGIERFRQSGASLLVFAWPAFWWLDHYERLHRCLKSQFPCLLQNDRLIIFDLSPREQSGAGFIG